MAEHRIVLDWDTETPQVTIDWSDAGDLDIAVARVQLAALLLERMPRR